MGRRARRKRRRVWRIWMCRFELVLVVAFERGVHIRRVKTWT